MEQAFDDLHAHLAVQAVNGLGGGVAEHAENTMRVIGDCLTCFVNVKDNLRKTQDHADD